MTAQLALDICEPTWPDPEPDPDDDGPRCTLDLNLGGQQATPYRLHTMTTVPIQGDLL